MELFKSLKPIEVQPTNAFRPDISKSKKIKVSMETTRFITPEIDHYISAMESFKSKYFQERTVLYDMYENMLDLDDLVNSLLDKRLDNITNRSIKAYRDGQPMEELDYFLDSPQFQAFTKDILLTKFFGFQLFEFDYFEFDNKLWFSYLTMPHKHVNPYTQEVLLKQTDERGVSYTNRPDYLFVGDKDSPGLFSKVCLNSIYYRRGIYSYASYLELAASNFRVIETREYATEEEIEEAEEALRNMGPDGSIRIPNGLDFSVQNQSSSSQNQLFEGYMEKLTERQSILILGQSMTTFDGSSYSQAEVHSAEQAAKYTADEQFVLSVLNFEFRDYLPLWFRDLNPENIEFRFEANTDKEVRAKIELYKALKEVGYEFSQEELQKAFGDQL